MQSGFLNKKIVVEFCNGDHAVIGYFRGDTDTYLWLDTGKELPEMVFYSGVKLIRLYTEKYVKKLNDENNI